MNQRITRRGRIHIGRNLRRLRNKQGLRQEDVAVQLQLKGLEVSRSIYGQMEMGIHGIPIPVLRALRELYRAEWGELLDPQDEMDG